MIRSILIPCLLLSLLGCQAERPFTDNSQDADLYAKDVKQIAYNAVLKAKRSREPGDNLRVLVSELEDQAELHRPLGQYQPIYAELLAIAKPLYEDCLKVNGKPTNLATRLDQIQKVAEKLPGEVQLDRGE